MCFPGSPRKRQHINKFDPHPFPGQSRKVVYFQWLFSPPQFWSLRNDTKTPDNKIASCPGLYRHAPFQEKPCFRTTALLFPHISATLPKRKSVFYCLAVSDRCRILVGISTPEEIFGLPPSPQTTSRPSLPSPPTLPRINFPLFSVQTHVYPNSVQPMVSGEYWEGVSPDTVLPDTVLPLREHLNSVQLMVSREYCEGVFPDTVCWTHGKRIHPATCLGRLLPFPRP